MPSISFEAMGPISTIQIYLSRRDAMATDSDDSLKEDDEVLKKCPICISGVIEFEEACVDAYGECNNEKSHEDEYDSFEVIKLQPFTVKHVQAPLHTYTMPAQIPCSITTDGLKFTLRDYESGYSWEEIRDAVLLTLEGLSDWMTDVVDTIEWDGVDWEDYEVEDEGITEYVLEDAELASD